MKHILLLLLFWAFAHQLFCQEGYQIVDTTKRWETIYISSTAYNVCYCAYNWTYHIGDTASWFGQQYRQVHRSSLAKSETSNWEVLIREDTLNKRVYLNTLFEGEGLLYDFGLQVGDSVLVENYYAFDDTVRMYCDSIDTIQLFGHARKRIFLHAEYSNYHETWLEGIGSNFGLLHSGRGGFFIGGGGPNLLCCSQNDYLLYMDTTFHGWFVTTFYPQLVSEYFDTAYVNMPYSFQLEWINPYPEDSVSFFAVDMPDGFSLDEATGLITGQPQNAGSFLCRVTIRNHRYSFNTDIINGHMKVVSPVSLAENAGRKAFSIYPNPCREFLSISDERISRSPYFVELYNSMGQLLVKRQVSDSRFQLDCSQLGASCYLLRFYDENRQPILSEVLIKK